MQACYNFFNYNSKKPFSDIYRNPEVLQLYLNRSSTHKTELKTKDSMRKAIDKYNSKLSEIKIRVKPGIKDRVKARAAEKGLSVQSYIISLIDNDI